MTKCETCKKGADPVPYIVHESAMARQERTIKRLWILLLVTVCLLVGTNGLWIYYESQFSMERTFTEIEQEVDTGDGDAFVVGNGDLNYGEGQAESQNDDH